MSIFNELIQNFRDVRADRIFNRNQNLLANVENLREGLGSVGGKLGNIGPGAVVAAPFKAVATVATKTKNVLVTTGVVGGGTVALGVAAHSNKGTHAGKTVREKSNGIDAALTEAEEEAAMEMLQTASAPDGLAVGNFAASVKPGASTPRAMRDRDSGELVR